MDREKLILLIYKLVDGPIRSWLKLVGGLLVGYGVGTQDAEQWTLWTGNVIAGLIVYGIGRFLTYAEKFIRTRYVLPKTLPAAPIKNDPGLLVQESTSPLRGSVVVLPPNGSKLS